jgi:hypothetical protein
MLVVMGIVAFLAAFLIPTVRKARLRAARAECWGQLQLLVTGLSMYEADTRRLPRLAPRAGAGLFHDDAPALCAALHNLPTTTTGGGPSHPYLRGTVPLGRLVDRRRLEPGSMGEDGEAGVVLLDEYDMQLAQTLDYQVACGPTTAEPLVFVDPWGAPFHYREWGTGVASTTIEALQRDPPARAGFTLPPGSGEDPPVSGPVLDRPARPFQVWSNGPNGVNEYGEGDDLASWKGAP